MLTMGGSGQKVGILCPAQILATFLYIEIIFKYIFKKHFMLLDEQLLGSCYLNLGCLLSF